MTALAVVLLLAVESAELQPRAQWSLEQTATVRWLVSDASDSSQGMIVSWSPKWERRVNERVRWSATLRLRADAYDRLEPGRSDQDESSRASRRVLFSDQAELEVRELFVEIDAENGFWRIGKQPIVWGQTDGFKILDVVNPQDLREFVLEDFADSRIALWSVLRQRRLGRGTLQLFVISDATFHREPEGHREPESHREPRGEALFALPVGDQQLASLWLAADAPNASASSGSSMPSMRRGPRERPSHLFSGLEAGVRWSWSAGGWDLSLNALRHHNDLAVRGVERVPVQDDTAQAHSEVVITPTHRRAYLAGGTASRSFGSWVLRSELAWDRRWFEGVPLPSDAVNDGGLVHGDELAAGVGLDWRGPGQHVLSGQLLIREPSAGRPLVRAALRRDLSFAWRWSESSQRLGLQLFALHGLEAADGLIRFDTHFRWRDRLELTLGADVFYGDRESLLGHFDQRDRLRLGVRTAW